MGEGVTCVADEDGRATARVFVRIGEVGGEASPYCVFFGFGVHRGAHVVFLGAYD